MNYPLACDQPHKANNEDDHFAEDYSADYCREGGCFEKYHKHFQIAYDWCCDETGCEPVWEEVGPELTLHIPGSFES